MAIAKFPCGRAREVVAESISSMQFVRRKASRGRIKPREGLTMKPQLLMGSGLGARGSGLGAWGLGLGAWGLGLGARGSGQNEVRVNSARIGSPLLPGPRDPSPSCYFIPRAEQSTMPRRLEPDSPAPLVLP